jgi:hypothetical protein
MQLDRRGAGMANTRLYRILVAIAFSLAAILFAEHGLGLAILQRNGPDPTTGTAAMWTMFLGLLVLLAGRIAELRDRVEVLERRLRDVRGPDTDPGIAPDRRPP